MYGSNDYRYERTEMNYTRLTANLHATVQNAVRELNDLDVRINGAIRQALNDTLDSRTSLDDLLDAQTNLEKIYTLLKQTRIAEVQQPKEVDVVTVEMIRETFYNMIPIAVSDAIQEELISDKAEYFDDLDGGLYPSIAALTLLTVLKQSQGVDGILLLNRKVVNQHNCPLDVENENSKKSYQELIKVLLAHKKTILELSSDALRQFKYYTVHYNEPRPVITQEMNTLLGIFWSIGIKVSQLPNFKKVAGEAVKMTSRLV